MKISQWMRNSRTWMRRIPKRSKRSSEAIQKWLPILLKTWGHQQYHSLTHCFELTSENPIYQKARSMSPSHNEIVRKEIDCMLLVGILIPVESLRKSPVVIATEKDEYLRFCIDYWKLNSLMHACRWPLPPVYEIPDDIRGSSVITTIDLFQGYCRSRWMKIARRTRHIYVSTERSSSK